MFINIEIERLRHHMTKKEMAIQLSISQATLHDWICKRQPIPAGGLRALSQLFGGISLDYLLSEDSLQ